MNVVYKRGDYYVREIEGKYVVCDVDGIAKGEELEHIGDEYPTLAEAKADVDHFSRGGHWSTRPRNSIYT